MKAPKTIKSIKAANDGNTLLVACAILQHRPNMRNKVRKEYKKYENKYGHLVYNYFSRGFEEGYKYAIERLQKHNS